MAVHVVRKGENLWGISRMYGIPLQTVAQVNGLTSTTSLVPGLALYLPDTQLPIRYYHIKAGDQIWQIANLFNTNAAAILAANPRINPNRMVIGQIIAIPSPIKMNLTTLGFIVPSAIGDILTTLDTLANQLTYLAVVAYSFTEEGFAFNEIEDSDIVTKCNQLNITPLLMIRNYTKGDFSAELAGKVLENPVYRW